MKYKKKIKKNYRYTRANQLNLKLLNQNRRTYKSISQSMEQKGGYERLSKEFVESMYENMWQFMNLNVIHHILKDAGCKIKTMYKEKLEDNTWPKAYHNSICFKGTEYEGHYVFVKSSRNITGTYESKLIYEEDDGICHGAALAVALYSCGYKEIGKLIKNPKNNYDINNNYNIILGTYIYIIKKGWWDKALHANFYGDVNWINGETTTRETQTALKILTKYKLLEPPTLETPRNSK